MCYYNNVFSVSLFIFLRNNYIILFNKLQYMNLYFFTINLLPYYCYLYRAKYQLVNDKYFIERVKKLNG